MHGELSLTSEAGAERVGGHEPRRETTSKDEATEEVVMNNRRFDDVARQWAGRSWSRRRLAISLAGGAAALGAALNGEPAAARTRRVTKRYDIAVSCTSTGQLCSPLWPDPPLSFRTAGAFGYRFVASASSCSDIKPYFLLDGVRYFTEFLAPGQATVLSTTILPGTHSLQWQAEGRTGGCNPGSLAAWEATLWLTTSKRVRR